MNRKINLCKNFFCLFQRGVDDKAKSKYERERIQQAKRIMRPFVLRRLKSEVKFVNLTIIWLHFSSVLYKYSKTWL